MFGTIQLRLRPLKLGYLVNPSDPQQVRGAIRLSTSLWGGTYDPIIPVYKKTPSSWADKPGRPPSAETIIGGFIDAFDPDILVQFTADLPKAAKQSGLRIIKPDDVWHHYDREGELHPTFGIGIFEIAHGYFDEYFKYKMKYPPKVIVPSSPNTNGLFWASLFGEIPEKLSRPLKDHYFEPLEVEECKFAIARLPELMAGRTTFPRRISGFGLQHHHHSGLHERASIFFFDAARSDDIVDFWNLRATGRRVLPVPEQYSDTKEFRQLAMAFLKANRVPWRHNPEHCDCSSIIRGRHTDLAHMEKWARSLDLTPGAEDRSTDPFFSLQRWYPRIWDEWARDKDGAVPHDIFLKEDTIEVGETNDLRMNLKPIMPDFMAEYGYTGEPRCANEITFRFYGSQEYLAEAFPKRPGENVLRVISSVTAWQKEWRVGRNGIAILVKDDHTQHWQVPGGESVVLSWLRDQGWQPELSPAGRLAKQMLRQLEGFVGLLKRDKLLGLIEHMNGGSVGRDSTPRESNKIDEERELPAGELKRRLAEMEPHGKLYESLLSKGIFRVGVRLQCDSCSRHSWYPLPEVRDEFTCPKCLKSFPAVGHVDTATWCYKTAGPFSVPRYADGAYAVLLAVDFLGDRGMGSLRASPTLSFTAKKSGRADMEADFAMLWQEDNVRGHNDGVLFGECKSYGPFEAKDFRRMRHLASEFPGAVLAFCTLREHLKPGEVREIAKIAMRGRKYWKAERPVNPVLVLTGTELFSFHRPPYCWNDELRQRFSHVFGLFEICNATQQIYLNLPSWHDTWQKRWEKRRVKRQQMSASIAQRSRPTEGRGEDLEQI